MHMPDPVNYEADVLIIGGGMAAAWAAISAARAGALVALVDKGYVGSSGIAAVAGPGHWWIPPDPAQREAAIDRRLQTSFGLADKDWMATILDITWHTLPQLAPYYPFAPGGDGKTFYNGVRGPEYMRALRRFALASGVRVLDHHPALELLIHDDGSVAGAAGYARQARQSWQIRAGAVVLATGGCAFRSGLIGSHNNTGDGHLMAAEAGAELSGMEFSVAFSISPVWHSTRNLPYMAARFFDASGNELDVPPLLAGRAYQNTLARALAEGPVYAEAREAPAQLKSLLHEIHPAASLAFERKGLNIFEDRFEVKLIGEGTVRGTGGLRITDRACQTSVPGLFAAGDVATRELVAGATTGGGGQNGAWALTSGILAGAAAAARTRHDGRRAGDKVKFAGGAALRPSASAKPGDDRADDRASIRLAQDNMLSLEKSLWREATALTASQQSLDAAWRDIAAHRQANGAEMVGAREAAALIAVSRWCNTAALARTESRGMHVRSDAPALETDLARRQLVGGLDTIWTRYESDQPG